MSFDFSGKIALVTGATSGIGAETAIAFAKAGAKVAITGRREDRGRAVLDRIISAGAEGLFIRADVSSESDCRDMVRKTVEKFGRLDCAFNNAGIEGVMSPTTEATAENFDKVFSVNVKGVLLSMKHEIPAMLAGGGGAIVNCSSIAGTIGTPGFDTYCASKHAVNGLTKCAAVAYAKEGIRINAVGPAAIETDMWSRVTAGNEEFAEVAPGMHPIGRIGQPREIADAVLWMCSEHASFLVGQTLYLDGGFTVQ